MWKLFGIFSKPKGRSSSVWKGPLVQNGPNAGKVRSRCNNGRWRKKRNDTGRRRK